MKKFYILLAALGLSNAVLNAQNSAVTETVDVLMTEGSKHPEFTQRLYKMRKNKGTPVGCASKSST